MNETNTEHTLNYIDGILATKIMGWSVKIGKNATDYTPRCPDIWIDKHGREFGLSVWEFNRGYVPWSPSTKISQAFEVVKKLLLDGAEIIIRPHIKSTFVEIFYNGRWYEDYAETPEMAICRAILRSWRDSK